VNPIAVTYHNQRVAELVVKQVKAMAKAYRVPVVVSDTDPCSAGFISHTRKVKGAVITLSSKITYDGKTLEEPSAEVTAITILHEYAHLLQIVRGMPEIVTSSAGSVYGDMEAGTQNYPSRERQLALRHLLLTESDAELFAIEYLQRSGFKTNWARAYRRATGSLLHGVVLLRYGISLSAKQRQRIMKELKIPRYQLYSDSVSERRSLDDIVRRDREKLREESHGYWIKDTFTKKSQY
jgi:hypothetical protein